MNGNQLESRQRLGVRQEALKRVTALLRRCLKAKPVRGVKAPQGAKAFQARLVMTNTSQAPAKAALPRQETYVLPLCSELRDALRYGRGIQGTSSSII